ncbi:MAG: ABC transporter permease [Candidatus Solibacter usitatus]|nr:ABC transporter permease [Candidatus Solibacter usitatus]
MKSVGALTAGVGLALATIREHKLRAFLTVLGVIIGTSTVIGVGSIIAGLDQSITEQVKSFGPNTIIVLKMTGIGLNRSPEEWRRKPLTLENARAIAERCPSVEYVSPYLWPDWRGINRARYKGNDLYQIQMGGTEEGYAAGGTIMKFGRFFSQMDNQKRLPVAVIGEDIQKAWFPNLDPVGKVIDVNGRPLEVIGVMERPAASMPGSEDLRILLPYFTMRKMFPSAREHMLVVLAYPGKLAQAQDEVRAVLRLERRVPHSKPDTFWMSTAERMIDQFHQITAVVALVMVVLSSIGLLVGGIGVMNIMLVSVTERTREIGIRKAVGARRTDIVIQFLTEAVVLTGLGGLFGMSLGWLISLLVRVIFPSLPTAVPAWAAVLGVAVSVGVGLFFGIWPAGKAARLDPVVALRYE